MVIAVPGDALALLDATATCRCRATCKREDRASDRERYQTMFARVPGAVAAPTAGLHMTPGDRSTRSARAA